MKLSRKPALLIALGSACLLALVVGIFYLIAQSDSSGKAQASLARYRAAGLEIAAAIDPETPKVGDNRLIVEVQNGEGNPVKNLDIDAYAEMPAMGAMSAMRAPADLKETAPGHYEGTIDLPMRGEWPLTIQFKAPQGEPVRLQFDLATGRKGLAVASGATPVDSTAGKLKTTLVKGFVPAGPFQVAVSVEPDPPKVGDNRIVIKVRDADGEPVTDATVRAVAEMPAMGTMPAMHAQADIEEIDPGIYAGDFELSMRGEWPLAVDIDTGEQHVDLTFDMATGREGLKLATATPGGDAAYYTCPMHPSVKSATPGSCPICGMDLVPVTKQELKSGSITVDAKRRQMIGVETGKATHRDLVRAIRAVGEVTYDERLLSHITLKFDGYIGDLKADYVGAPIEKGEVLFTVYSPELLTAQQEYLETFKRAGSFSGGNSLLQAARQRLQLWDMSEADIATLERRGTPQPYVAIRAPRSGTLIERNIADGGAAPMGKTLLTIADLSRVWVEAEVFEGDLALIEPGMRTTITLPYLPGKTYTAAVEYVYPFLEGATRTGRIRLTLDNASGELKPDMYAQVSLKAELGRHLSVPEEAVIVAGETRVVFVDQGNGRLQPVRVKTGRRAQGFVEVLDGLSLGDTVVTSGNFLIAAEARLKTGIQQW